MLRKVLPMTLVLLLVGVTAGSLAQQVAPAELRAADNLWDNGDYIAAMNAYIKLLNSTNGDQYFDAIALQTGELFVSEELTSDGRNPRMSLDGRFIAYEIGPAKSTVTRIQRMAGKHETVVDIPGTGVAFSRNGTNVAFVKTSPSDEWTKAQEALDKAPETGAERAFAQATVSRLQARLGRIVVRNLETQRETELQTGSLLKSTLAFAADNETVYFVGAAENDTRRNDIYAATATAQPVVLTDADGFKTAPVVGASGKAMLISIGNQTPFPVPQPPAPAGADDGARGGRGGGGGGAPAGGGGRGGPGGPAARFGLVDIATHTITTVTGSAPVFSDDGNAIAYLNTVDRDNTIMTMPIGGTATPVVKTAERLAAPSFSPDGKKITYQKMWRDDFEIYVVNTDGKEEMRVTHEIQHDAVPRFITNNRILAVIGEPRHRRSYVYDLPSLKKTRVFHNNTIRTIAPEYTWQTTPDGSKVLISAERDGDTITADRGVYLVDLNRKITRPELTDRIQRNITSESVLHEFADKIYQPMASNVQKIVNEVSQHKVFEHEKALVGFDSKHISQPGNRKAIEYLTAQYKSFGYDPQQQWFEPRGALVPDGKSANIVSRLVGTENPDLIYVVSSHFDSVAAGPGADDNTSGTSALLEAARVMYGHPLAATIVFASFTGEEAGLLGSREFARVAKEGKWNIVGALNNDTVGWSDNGRMDNTIRYSNAAIRDIQHSAAMLFTRLITYDAHYYKSTDAAALFDAFGDIIGGIGSYPVLGSPHYHTANDLLDTINFQQVAETSKTTVATLMYLASTPSPVKNLKLARNQNGSYDVTWDASPEKSVRSYLVTFGGLKGERREVRANTPKATITGAKAGDVVMVKAINTRGIQGWDWTRVTIE